jgi:hypothetical protein
MSHVLSLHKFRLMQHDKLVLIKLKECPSSVVSFFVKDYFDKLGGLVMRLYHGQVCTDLHC